MLGYQPNTAATRAVADENGEEMEPRERNMRLFKRKQQEPEQCEHCRFFAFPARDCRRHSPPTSHIGSGGVNVPEWPGTGWGYWCGDFERGTFGGDEEIEQ